MTTKLLPCMLALALVPQVACARQAADRADAEPPPIEVEEAAVPAELRVPDVPYVPTPYEVVDRMLEMARVGERDVVYDLGCGDGRIVITAVQKFEARQGVCVDIDPDRILDARANAEVAGVEDRIRFIEGDLFDVDLRPASVITLYLLSDVNLRLRPKLLREARPGTRVVSHDFHMGSWEPEQEEQLAGSTIYYWTVPADVEALGLPEEE